MKRLPSLPSLPLLLLIAIPAASVIMGIITMVLAFSGPDQEMLLEQAPLSKVSWREEATSAERASEPGSTRDR